ncbi:MAG: LytR/AlgR family response regulator transcription factor [Bacteroidia bacterium]
MIKAIALDDEPLALGIIEKFCQKLDYIKLEQVFTKPNEAELYLEKNAIQLVFLDIQMPSKSGIEFFKIIPNGCKVIFTTAFADYAVEGFNLNAADYLLKPFSFDRFKTAVDRVKEYFDLLKSDPNHEDNYFNVRADYSLHRIRLNDILYFEGFDDYVKIITTQMKPIVARLTMKSLQDKLPADQFVRVHRSYIIPLNKIEQVKNKLIKIGEKEIPIGGAYEADFSKRFS